MKRPPMRILATSVAATATLALVGCSTTPATTSPMSEPAMSAAEETAAPLTVLTAFYPLQYLTEQIGGDLVSIDSLTPAGAEPHDLELTPAKVDSLRTADVVVYLKGFQSAVDEAVEATSPANVVDVSTAVQLVAQAETDHATEEAAHEDHDHEHEGHDHEAESGEAHDHDHDIDGKDPHFWLDPTRMAQAATAIGQALAQADPTNAQTYTANAATVKRAMEDLSAEIVQGTAQCTHTTFVTSHEAFGYLADRTGLTQVGISGLDPDSSPSPARLQEISTLVKEQGLTTIFTEALIDPKVAQTLADDLGITTAVLDPLESQSDPSKDYADVMKENLEALRKALDCK